MFIVGLTGGIGSGKSTVESLFQSLGTTVVDADQIAHRLVEAGQPALEKIVRRFGPHILTEQGALNRKALREIVFRDGDAKAQLESILHPLVYQQIAEQLAVGNTPYGIASVPLLIESRHQDEFDRILVVDCAPATQIARIKQRDGLDDALIANILKSQCTREERLRWATDVIINEGDLDSLKDQVQTLHARYLSLASDID